MQPLSKTKRRIYLYLFALFFVVLIPVVALYASGYRYKSGFGVVQTGGIFVAVPYSGATVEIDGRLLGESGLLERSFFAGNLTPGAYEIVVSKEGFRNWRRVVVVEQRLVTDALALLIPDDITPILLSATSSVSNAALTNYRGAFLLPVATTSLSSIAGEKAVVEEGNVYVLWSGEDVLPPSTFCGRPSYCIDQIPIEEGTSTATNVAFFGGGVVYATKEDGVLFRETDARPTAVQAHLYSKPGSDFRIVNGQLIVKDGASYYRISL